jgi:hypothetical protein
MLFSITRTVFPLVVDEGIVVDEVGSDGYKDGLDEGI